MTFSRAQEWGLQDDSQLRYLVTQCASGRCVLFVGAGLSLACVDDGGRHGPTGPQLAEELAQRFLGESAAKRPLSLIAEFSLTNASKGDIDHAVAERLGGLRPTDAIGVLPIVPWRSIFTTNFDTIIEQAYQSAGELSHNATPVYSSQTNLSQLGPNEIPLYKVHGSIDRINSSDGQLSLTNEDLARARREQSKIFQRLADEIGEYTVLYLGYGREDHTFHELLGEVLNAAGGVDGLRRSFALSPGFKEYERARWERSKISLINTSAEDFLPWLAGEVRTLVQEASVKEEAIPSLLTQGTSLPSALVTSFRGSYEVVAEEMASGSAGPESFFKGDRLGWGQLGTEYDARRDITDDVLELVLDQQSESGVRTILLFGEAGAGKTTVLRRVGADLASVWQLPAISLRDSTLLAFRDVAPLCATLEDRLHILIDDAADHVREIGDFVQEARGAGADVTLILASRNNEWTDRVRQTDVSADGVFQLEYLTEPEIDRVIDRLAEFGELGHLQTLSPLERKSAFRDNAERQLLVALREATEGKRFEDIIVDEFNSITSESARNAYLFVCCVYRVGVPLRAGILRRLTGVPFDAFHEKLLGPSERILVEDRLPDDIEYRARHPIIAEIVSNHLLPTPEQLLQAYLTIISLLDIGSSDIVSFRKISRNRPLVDSLHRYELRAQFYKACRETAPDDPIVAQHWAIAAMAAERFGTARQQLADARRLAPRDTTIQHTAGMLALTQYRHTESGDAWERVHFAAAEKEFLSLTRRAKRDAHAYDSLADLYEEKARRSESGDRMVWYGKAQEVLADGIDQVEDKSGLIAAEAGIHERLGEIEDADQDFREALRIEPRNSHARILYARYLQRSGHFDASRKQLESGLELDKDDRRLRQAYGEVLAALNRPQSEVEAQYRLAMGHQYQNWNAAYEFAVYLFSTSREDEADGIFRTLGERGFDQRELRRTRRQPLFWKGVDRDTGRVVLLRDTFGFIRRPTHSLDIYFSRYRIDDEVDADLSEGVAVDFEIGFTLLGPMATRIRIRG